MKPLEISRLDSLNRESPLSIIAAELDKQEKNLIDKVPWVAFSYKPQVSFAIAYNDCIFIKYYVAEKSIRAVYTTANQPVYKDTCVEFFISFNGEQAYYNLEFNCIGTCLAGFGTGKSARNLLPVHLINTIRHDAFLHASNDEGKTDINWELTLMIPLEVFEYHKIASLKDVVCRGNFFKCGDELSEPHFLAWHTITAESPDFHLPQFFGNFRFL